MLRQVSAAFEESERQADNARRAEAYAREQEAPFKAAQEEVDAALAEVKAQEDARNNKTEDLKRKSTQGGKRTQPLDTLFMGCLFRIQVWCSKTRPRTNWRNTWPKIPFPSAGPRSPSRQPSKRPRRRACSIRGCNKGCRSRKV